MDVIGRGGVVDFPVAASFFELSEDPFFEGFYTAATRGVEGEVCLLYTSDAADE